MRRCETCVQGGCAIGGSWSSPELATATGAMSRWIDEIDLAGQGRRAGGGRRPGRPAIGDQHGKRRGGEDEEETPRSERTSTVLGDARQNESSVYFADECAVAARPPHAGTDPLSAQASRQPQVVAFLQDDVSALVRSRIETAILSTEKEMLRWMVKAGERSSDGN